MARRTPTPTTSMVILEADLLELLDRPLDDDELRARLAPLAPHPGFPSLILLWGPTLYRRNRVLFRSFILDHFPRSGMRLAWGSLPETMDGWLDDAQGDPDPELFRRLYAWKITTRSGGADLERWWADVKGGFTLATTWQERARVLERYDVNLGLTEEWAIELYERDPAAARPFLLGHPIAARPGPLPARLMDSARARKDEEFRLALYRAYVPAQQWQEDAVRLCLTVAEPEQLHKALTEHHCESRINLVGCFYELLLERGTDVLPYVLEHLDEVAGFDREQGAFWLLGLARKFQWDDLTAALLRSCCGPEQFNREVTRLLDNVTLASDPAKVANRLRLLAGAARPLSSRRGGTARIHPLSEDNAVQLYRRFGEVLRGPLGRHVTRRTWATVRGELLNLAIAREDEPFLDQLAAEALTWLPPRHPSAPDAPNPSTTALARLVSYYQQRRSQQRLFAQRIASVLGRLPASAIGPRYRRLVRGNPLSRLFFEESLADFSSAPGLVRDLLEAAEISVQALGLRILARDGAADTAAGNLDLLVPMLFKPLTRRVRLLAFSALLNASTTPENARLIHDRARQTLALPAKGYPREPLIGLIGQLLHRWPELRRPAEQPVIHSGEP